MGVIRRHLGHQDTFLTMLLLCLLQTLLHLGTSTTSLSAGPRSAPAASQVPQQTPQEARSLDRRVDLERNVALDSDADWQRAVEKNLARQNLYNNVVKEVFNSFTRIIGWMLISLALYGMSNMNLLVERRGGGEEIPLHRSHSMLS